jgi:hypothetical protein
MLSLKINEDTRWVGCVIDLYPQPYIQYISGWNQNIKMHFTSSFLAIVLSSFCCNYALLVDIFLYNYNLNWSTLSSGRRI